MNLENIKKIIDLAKEENLSSISYENKEEKISIAFPYANSTTMIPRNISSQENVSKKEDIGDFIKAPFVGTFYSSSSPGEPPFVKVGQKVSKGETLCILEAMKIMNEIEADSDGIIEAILVENENFVEFDQKLFKIKKA